MARIAKKDAEALYVQYIRAGNKQAAKTISDSLGYVPQMDVGVVEAFGRGAGQGLTFGFQDEMSAALSAGAQSLFNDANYDDAYAASLDRIRGDNRMAAENPGYLPGEIAGSIISPVGAVGMGAKGASAAGRLLRGAGGGATQGALAGVGYSERQGTERLNDAGMPAAVGAATGAIVPAVAPRAVEGVRQLWDVATTGAERRAERIIGREMAGISSAKEGMDALRELGPAGMLVDLAPGAGVQAMARAGDAGLGGAVSARQAAAPSRARGILEQATGAKAASYDKSAEAITRKASLAGEGYDAIRRQEIPRELVDDILEINSPLVKSAMRNAQAAMAEEGIPVRLNDAYSVPLAFLDHMKRHLDSVAAMGAGPGSGVTGSQARRAARLAEELRDKIDDIVPEYAQTRGAYAEAMGELEALGASASNNTRNPGGRQIFNVTDPAMLDATADRVANMTPAEAANFRLGAAQGADDLMARRAKQNTNFGALINADVEDSVRSRVLDLIVPDSAAAAQARSALAAERQMFDTYARLSPNIGSKTQPNSSAVQRGQQTTVLSMLKEVLFPDGLTLETAEAMQVLLQRGDITEKQMKRIVENSARQGLLEVTPGQMEFWYRAAGIGTRASQGALFEE